MRQSWDEYFMFMAMTARERATCPRRQVGCVIVDTSNNVIATGYNGSEPGADHCTDVGCRMVDGSCKRTIHAEQNALARTTRRSRAGSTLYTTDFPCIDCANLIATKGVAQVVWMIPYQKGAEEVLQLFNHNGIVIRRFVPSIFNEDMTIAELISG